MIKKNDESVEDTKTLKLQIEQLKALYSSVYFINEKEANKINLYNNPSRLYINNQKIEQTQWHQLVCWGRQADIAEKFIDLYWKQSLPFQFNQYEPFTIHQSTGKQAKIISEIQNAQQQFKTLAALRKDVLYWNRLKRTVATTVKQMPVVYLQNLNGQTVEFLYCLEDSKQSLKLLPKVMYCLRQFSEIIEELCQKRWIDYVRLNKHNLIDI